MIKAIIADNNIQSRDLLVNQLKNIENIEVLACFENIFSINLDLNNIDLIIFDINSSTSKVIFDEIQILKEKYKNLNFIATSYEINSELVIQTLKEGVREFLLKPIISSILEAAIKKIEDIKNNINQNYSKTICVFSNKGGVGKTSISVNVAYEVAKQVNSKVCILDLSFNSEDITTFLNIKPKFRADYILDKLEAADEKTFLSLMDRYKDTNLYILSLQENMKMNIKFTPQLISKVINSLKNIFPLIIIDTSSNINESSVSIINNSNFVLLVGLMNLASVRSCQKCLELLDNMNYNNDKIKIVINRYIKNSDFTIQDIEKTLNREIFSTIPNNYLTLIDAINSGVPTGESNPQSNIAKAYKNIAELIVNMDFESIEETKRQYNHGIYNLLRRMGE